MGRLTRTVLGSGLALAGVAMLVLPGPGLVTIAAGLAVLGRDYTWAAAATDRVRGLIARWTPQAASQG